ncbi:MAG: hypothetical protein C5B59_13070 [Bacteroidetes bacterium]|nr:MAG: hypothetical protein C5B59_13070 [Bacteroidota bacterium]
MKYLRLAIFLSTVIIFSACSSSKKLSKTNVQVDTLPALPVSQVDIPVKIYANPLLAKAEQLVPKEFTSDSWPNFIQSSCDFRYKYRFVRSALSLSVVNNQVGIQFAGNYQVAGSRCVCTADKPVTPWISGSCGFGKEPMRRVQIAIRSQLNFYPTYQIHTATSLNKLQATDRCEVSLFSSDVTQLVMDSIAASVVAFCSALDQTIAGMSFAGPAHQAIEKSYQKTCMGKYGWLLINPMAIRVGSLNYVRDSFRIALGISCKPEISSDSVNHVSSPQALPPLDQKDGANGISLYVNASYDYNFISKLLTDTLRNKVFELKGRTIVVKEVEVKGLPNHQVQVKIDFAGSNKGSIYLRGTPVLDTAKQALSIPDITYSLEGHDLAIKVAKSLFKNKIKKTLQGNSYLDIAALVKSNLHLVNDQLNRELAKGIYSSGKCADMKVIGLLAREDKMLAQFQISGDVSVNSSGVF